MGDDYCRSIKLTRKVRLTTNLSHDGLNPDHVPYWRGNNPTLGAFGVSMIRGTDQEPTSKYQTSTSRRYERLAATSQLSLW